MNTGGSWRCNLTAATPSDPSTDPAGNPTNPAGSDGTASSNFFAAVFGRVADAGMKWRLEHFMRHYLAHECSQRQLKVGYHSLDYMEHTVASETAGALSAEDHVRMLNSCAL